jgi:hypothetical protein
MIDRNQVSPPQDRLQACDYTKNTPIRLALLQAIAQYRFLLSPSIAIWNSMGKFDGTATSIVAFHSDKLLTKQLMPPSKSILARLVLAAAFLVTAFA